jgi:hypothetical protein
MKMKIQIVQTEIEAAIRNYISEQITIKEGMQIDIDIRSTRGDVGFTADIDITPAKLKAAAPAPAPKVETAAPAAPVLKREEPAPKAAEVVSQGNELTPTSDETNTSTQAGEQTGDTEGSAEPEAVQGDNEAPPVEAPKKSLFGGLKRVSNAE